MPTLFQPLFTDTYLASVFDAELRAFRASGDDARLLERLRHWAAKDYQKETTAEADFVDVFFKQTWGHWGSGTRAKTDGYTLYPKFAVGSAGEGGGTGLADLALGWFGRDGVASTPQVVCEFKDVRSGLDKPQRRKGSDRSPVRQCADYLKEASYKLYGNEPIQPTWGVVSDMNEFRLYWRRTMPAQYQRFFIRAPKGEGAVGLIDDGEGSAFQRFVFAKLLRRDMVLTTGGVSSLEKLLVQQGTHERKLESDFYREYQFFREEIYHALVDENPSFHGTRGKLVRLAQRFLDRCIFILFCEDMGAALRFPPNVLRDRLIRASLDPYYDPADTSVWHDVKRLFIAMRDGTPFGDTRITRFNGGLFAEEPELENLVIPNRVFCTKGQGADDSSIAGSKGTLLFLSATYYFGTHGTTHERGIGLYTLGRIFEQSITDLEFMEAKADDRPSLTELSKRKRDGVYYTPEWVTYFVVEETVGAQLRDLRRRLYLDDGSTFTADELEKYRDATAARRKRGGQVRPPESVVSYLARLEQYAIEVEQLKVVDPACGSGAFLIQALDRLVHERRWIIEEREYITGKHELFDIDKVTKGVLTQNLYGVDLNPESVEITRLALWLHSALPDRPLCSLDENIRCGNSLVGPGFYAWRDGALFSDEQRERINAFDWQAAFRDVFSRPNGRAGFDCVIGNPPYVKFQNFRQVDPDVAEYLVEGCRMDGTPLYASTQTGNFDMYLPFLERGMELLNENGRMGFIAPSMWLVNEYGLGLRGKLAKTRRLERWVDFRDFQVFDEAITYTALQFFRGRPGHAVACIFAPDGKVAGSEWTHADAVVPNAELGPIEPWIFAPESERQLLRRLARDFPKLGDVATIIVGVQTSADDIYHLRRMAPGRYIHRRESDVDQEIEVEDAIMRPLVSGAQAKRYQTPSTGTFILYPYKQTTASVRLYTAQEMARLFPLAWAYLREHEKELRSRERNKFDDDEWYRFGRNQNIDKQQMRKILVPRLTRTLGVAVDPEGAVCLDNVDVNGILTDSTDTAWFLAGVLNGPISNIVWRFGAKPFQNGFRSANKQFIAPLPVPPADNKKRASVVALARELQQLHTERHDMTNDLDRRLASQQAQPDKRDVMWFWADVGNVDSWRKKAPGALSKAAKTAWAKAECERRTEEHLEWMRPWMHAGASFEVVLRAGELSLRVDGRAIIEGIFVDNQEAPFLAAQWRHKVRQTTATSNFGAKRLIDMLLDLRRTDNSALRRQVVDLDARVTATDDKINRAEMQMNGLLYELYALTPKERSLVEDMRGMRET